MHPDVLLHGMRIHQHTRIHDVVRVEDVLDTGEQVQCLGGVHRRQQGGAGPPVTMLTRHRTAVTGHQLGCCRDELLVACRAVRLVQRVVDATVHAPFTKVAVGQSVQVVLGEQAVEVAQIGSEPLRWDGGILPAGPSRFLQRDACQPGSVGADPPQCGSLAFVGDHPPVKRVRCRDQGVGVPASLGIRVRPQLHEDPTVPAGQIGDGLAGSGDDLDDPATESLTGHRAERQQGGDGVGSLGHRGVSQGHRDAARTLRHQGHACLGDDTQGPLGACNELGHVAVVLRQQVFHGVAGQLPGEGTELGANRAQIPLDEGADAFTGPVTRRCGGQRFDLTAGDDQTGTLDRVRGTTVCQGTRATGVVADHATDRAPARGGGIRPVTQTKRSQHSLQLFLNHSGLHPDAFVLDVDVGDLVHSRQVDDDAGAHGVAGATGTCSA